MKLPYGAISQTSLKVPSPNQLRINVSCISLLLHLFAVGRFFAVGLVVTYCVSHPLLLAIFSQKLLLSLQFCLLLLRLRCIFEILWVCSRLCHIIRLWAKLDHQPLTAVCGGQTVMTLTLMVGRSRSTGWKSFQPRRSMPVHGSIVIVSQNGSLLVTTSSLRYVVLPSVTEHQVLTLHMEGWQCLDVSGQ